MILRFSLKQCHFYNGLAYLELEISEMRKCTMQEARANFKNSSSKAMDIEEDEVDS